MTDDDDDGALCASPVVGVVVTLTGRGVDVVVYQPIEGSRVDADVSLFLLGQISTICIEVS